MNWGGGGYIMPQTANRILGPKRCGTKQLGRPEYKLRDIIILRLQSSGCDIMYFHLYVL